MYNEQYLDNFLKHNSNTQNTLTTAQQHANASQINKNTLTAP